MAMLSSKSAQEISWMLDDYGIKHGPVVDSTRALYEKKLREAMAKKRKPKPSSGQNFYREEGTSRASGYNREEEEVTYIHHRRPLRHDDFEDRRDRILRSEYEELDSIYEPAVYRTQASNSNLSRTAPLNYETQREGTPEKRFGQFVPLWLQILLFLIIVGILVYVFMNMESAETEPFKRLT